MTGGRAGNAMQADFATGKEKTGRGLRWVAETIVGLVYPPRCPICDRVTVPECVPCRRCADAVRLAEEPVCKRCGKPLDGERAEFCLDCGKRRHAYCQGKVVFVYQGNIRQSMYRFKYANRREYAAYYAREAAALYQDWVFKNQIEVIVPVPMYRWKKRRRGYNQAETFARALGGELGLPVDAGLVRRVRNTVPQKELNGGQRAANLKNAFQLAADIVKYKKILLVDDIYTTGTTIDTVSEVLLKGGAERIYYICVSIGAGF